MPATRSNSGKTTAKSTKSTNSTAKKPAARKAVKGTSTRKNTRTGSRSSKNAGVPDVVRDEVVMLLSIVFAIILLLSNFHLAGNIGEGINSFMFGMFGLLEYIFPIVIVGTVFFMVANKQLPVARIKTGAVYVCFLFLCGFVQKLSKEPLATAGIGEYFSYSAEFKAGGGMTGGLICKMLSPFGTGGTYVILAAIFIFCLVIITEKSIINGIRNRGTRAYQTAQDDYKVYREHAVEKHKQQEEQGYQAESAYEERVRLRREAHEKKLEERRIQQEEREAKKKELEERRKRTDNKVNGVTLNTEIPRTAPVALDAGDLHEVTLHFEGEDGFPIEDEFSKDIYDPEEVRSVSRTASGRKSSAKPAADVTEVVAEQLKDRQVNQVEPLTDAAAVAVEPITEDFIEDTDFAFEAPVENVEALAMDEAAAKAQQDFEQQSAETVRKVMNEKSTGQAHQRYVFPPLSLLTKGAAKSNSNQAKQNKQTAIKLQQTLQNFGVKVTITDISCGPSVTRYELQPEQGVKVNKIVSLSDDIKLNLAATDIRIEAPIPGKAAIGIEVPNKETASVTLRELLESEEFKKHTSPIAFAAGKDIAGKTIVADIAKMPHLLIAGATGSGKSVCINTIIMSILYSASPEDVKLIMVDPKVVELSVYNGIPHLMIPVVSDPKKASAALNWAVTEMEKRYKLFAEYNVRDLKGFNQKVSQVEDIEDDRKPQKMPQIVIIIDELADLMMVAPGEVEDAICRLAQLARAAGIHLVIATQRPSVNVITGLIKANVPSRIAFSVSSGVDSRTIIDMNGAEKLLGRGDMLFYPSGYPKPVRVQGAFVSDQEVGAVVDFLKEHIAEPEYNEDMTQLVESGATMADSQSFGSNRDEYFAEAGRFIIEKEKASIGMIQRYYKVGFNRAARIMDQLAQAGVVGPEEGTKPRKILMTMDEFEQMLRTEAS